MVRNRKGLAPWSLAREAGIESATVDGTIEVPQYVQPTIDTGFVDEKGDWKGVKSSDKEFIALQIDAAIANGGEFLTPNANSDGSWPIDMTGYTNIFIALKPTNAGSYSLTAVMGPDSNSFANLSPINASTTLRGVRNFGQDIDPLFQDAADTMTANVWNIFIIKGTLVDQKLLRFKVVNNSGGESTIESAFMRVV